MKLDERNFTKLCDDWVNNPTKLQKLLKGRKVR
jgi:hypothetical protein